MFVHRTDPGSWASVQTFADAWQDLGLVNIRSGQHSGEDVPTAAGDPCCLSVSRALQTPSVLTRRSCVGRSIVASTRP